MQVDLWNRIHPIVSDCCLALLSNYGVSVHCAGEVERAQLFDEGLAAFIGFLGDTLRGALVISAPAALIARAVPVKPGDGGVPEEQQRDWACELANQLLGRMKLRLAQHGVDFEMSTPSVMMGRDLRGFRSGETARVLRFDGDRTSLYVEFEAQATAEFYFLETPIVGEVSVQEGELLMLI